MTRRQGRGMSGFAVPMRSGERLVPTAKAKPMRSPRYRRPGWRHLLAAWLLTAGLSAQATVVTLTLSGKIAQVGQRLVDGVARQMADDFFRRFDEEMQRRYPQEYAAEAALPAAAPAAAPAKRMPAWVWVLFAAVVLLAILLLVRR